MWGLNIFNGWPFGSFMEDDIFATEGNFFAEWVTDPIIGEEESFVGNWFVAFKDDAVEVLYFSFGVFGSEEYVFESWDGLSVVYGDFDEESLVEVGGIEVVYDFESSFEIPGVFPG